MALESRITQEEIRKIPEKPIDREKVSYKRFIFAWFVRQQFVNVTLASINEPAVLANAAALLELFN